MARTLTDEEFVREWIVKLNGTVRITDGLAGFAPGIQIVVPNFLGKGPYHRFSSDWREAVECVLLLESISLWHKQPA